MDERLTGRLTTGADKVLPSRALVHDRFVVERPVALNVHATSYHAKDTVTGCRVVLRVLHRQFADRVKGVERAEAAVRRAAGALGSCARPLIVSGRLPEGGHFQVYGTIQGERADRLLAKGAGRPGLGLDVFEKVVRGFAVLHAAGAVHGQFEAASVWVGREWPEGNSFSVECTGFGDRYLEPAGESDVEPNVRDDVRSLAKFLRQCVASSAERLSEEEKANCDALIESALQPCEDSPIANAGDFCKAWEAVSSRESEASSERSTISPLSGLAPAKADRNVTRQGLAPPFGQSGVDSEVNVSLRAPAVPKPVSPPARVPLLGEASGGRLTPLPVVEVAQGDEQPVALSGLKARPVTDANPFAHISDAGAGTSRWWVAVGLSCLLAGGVALAAQQLGDSSPESSTPERAAVHSSEVKRATVRQALTPEGEGRGKAGNAVKSRAVARKSEPKKAEVPQQGATSQQGAKSQPAKRARSGRAGASRRRAGASDSLTGVAARPKKEKSRRRTRRAGRRPKTRRTRRVALPQAKPVGKSAPPPRKIRTEL